jgi:CTP:molybdopterin cytidylyltransferase MocA
VIGALILAAGEGRRFGGPKQLATVGGRALIERVVDNVLAVPALDPVAVVLGARADEIRARADLRGVPVVLAADWAEGQAASLRAGVAALGGVEAVVVLLADQPFITPQVIAGAMDHFAPAACDAVRTTYDGRPGHPVVLGRRVLDAVPGLRGDTGARDLLASFRVRNWEAGHLCDPTDIDTPDQLEVQPS